MGKSDRKSSSKHGDDRKKKSSKHSSSKRRAEDSDIDDERKHRKRRKRDDERRKSKKHSRDDRKKDRKHSSSKHSSKKDKKKRDKHSHDKRKASLIPLGDRLGEPPKQLLDAEKDYFAFHQHLWVYLFREEGVAFNDLTSEESHEAFARFVKRYNSGALEVGYYDPNGLPSEVIEECKTTRHSWTFKTDERENKHLRSVQEGIRKQTEYSANESKETSAQQVAPSTAMQPDGDRPSRTAEDRYRDRVTNRRLKHHVQTVTEELTGGRKIGRERQIEKKKETAARIHGAARDKEAGVELADSVIYGEEGGGDLNFKAALEREKRNAGAREEKRKQRLEELQRKEKEKEAEMLRKLGLTGIKPGQKIKIAPRKDDE